VGDIVNLRVARKRKFRLEAEKAADASRIAHGRPKADREKSEMERTIVERRLDGHHLEGVTSDNRDD
jgi:hypothetical protein